MPAFHEGEVAVQRRMDAADVAGSMADYVTRHEITPPAARFLEQQTLVAAAYVDAQEVVRAELCSGPPGFVEVVDAETIRVTPTTGVPGGLHAALRDGGRLGITAIDLTTRRRAKCKGWAVSDDDQIELRLDRIYALCPKYIQKRAAPRRWQPRRREQPIAELGTAVQSVLQSADTAFIGTFHASVGPDASHRGGDPGFIEVTDSVVRWEEYEGNNMFNSLGNLELDNRLALAAIDFHRGAFVEITGSAHVSYEARPVVSLAPLSVRWVDGGIPAEWELVERSRYNPPVRAVNAPDPRGARR